MQAWANGCQFFVEILLTDVSFCGAIVSFLLSRCWFFVG